MACHRTQVTGDEFFIMVLYAPAGSESHCLSSKDYEEAISEE
jgi:hypothetical protein